MNKNTKVILVVVVIVLLIFGIILAVYNNFKSEPVDVNTTDENNILDNANNGLENLINDILDDENATNEENTSNNNLTSNSESSGSTQSNSSSSSKNNDSDNNATENQTTPGEEKAIELVKAEWKKEWGNLNDVSFNNVMIQSDGKYVVSVNDSKTTKVIRRYVVDTVTGLVEEKD